MNWNDPNYLFETLIPFTKTLLRTWRTVSSDHWPFVKGRQGTVANKGQFNSDFGGARDPDEGDQTLPLIDGDLE